MVVRPLEDRHNKLVRHVEGLLKSRSQREKSREVVLEGPHLAEEALAADAWVRTVLYSPRLMERVGGRALLERLIGGRTRTVLVSDGLLDAVGDVDTHQGILVVARYELPTLDVLTMEPWVLVDGVQDPGNLGTILRSAAAFGFRVGVLPGSVDPFNPKVVRASVGTLFRAGIALVPPLVEVPSGLAVVAADQGGQVPYTGYDWKLPTALVVGNEGAGVSGTWLGRAGRRVVIPMNSVVESLNVGVAASIVMSQAWSARHR